MPTSLMSATPLTILFFDFGQLGTHEESKRYVLSGHSVQLFSLPKQSEHGDEQLLHSLVPGFPNWPFLQWTTQLLVLPVLLRNLPSSQREQFSADPMHFLQLGLHLPQVPSVRLMKYPSLQLARQSREWSGPWQITPASSEWSQFSLPHPMCGHSINDASLPAEIELSQTFDLIED